MKGGIGVSRREKSASSNYRLQISSTVSFNRSRAPDKPLQTHEIDIKMLIMRIQRKIYHQ